jgi:hypothetical protein
MAVGAVSEDMVLESGATSEVAEQRRQARVSRGFEERKSSLREAPENWQCTFEPANARRLCVAAGRGLSSSGL